MDAKGLLKLVGDAKEKLFWASKRIEPLGTYTGIESFEKSLRAEIYPEIHNASRHHGPVPRLRYLPDNIRKLIIEKRYWRKQHQKRPCDPAAMKQHHIAKRQLKAEILKHTEVLKNLDKMLIKKVSSTALSDNFLPSSHLEDNTHFSQSLDADRVQAVVTHIKENESDAYVLLNLVVGSKEDYIQLLYNYYAIYATYGEFVITPPSLPISEKTELNNKLNAMFEFAEAFPKLSDAIVRYNQGGPLPSWPLS